MKVRSEYLKKILIFIDLCILLFLLYSFIITYNHFQDLGKRYNFQVSFPLVFLKLLPLILIIVMNLVCILAAFKRPAYFYLFNIIELLSLSTLTIAPISRYLIYYFRPNFILLSILICSSIIVLILTHFLYGLNKLTKKEIMLSFFIFFIFNVIRVIIFHAR